MTAAIDSFVKYLETELRSVIRVAYLQVTPEFPDAGRTVMDALNVRFLTMVTDAGTDKALVSLDLVGSSQRTVMGWADAARRVLRQTQYTPERVYDPDPVNPVDTGLMVFWDAKDADFELVGASDGYVQMTCTLTLNRAA